MKNILVGIIIFSLNVSQVAWAGQKIKAYQPGQIMRLLTQHNSIPDLMKSLKTEISKKNWNFLHKKAKKFKKNNYKATKIGKKRYRLTVAGESMVLRL